MRWALAWLVLAACGRWGFSSRASSDASADDGAAADDADDAPSPDAALPKNLAFVTSTAQQAASLGGLGGADALCTTLAHNAGHPGTYVAWLSATGANALDRLGTARGWVRQDGRPVADTVADLVTGKLYYPILLDETGAAHPANNDYTVTGTLPNGSLADTAPCADWTADGNAPTYGIPSSGIDLWTAWANTGCTNSTRVYCFQTDYHNPVAAPTAPGARLAFVSSPMFGPSVSADGVCASDATSAGLSSTFLALLADDGTTAVSRFTITTPWYRRDGVRVTADLATLDAPLDVDVTGAQAHVLVFTGAPDPQTSGNQITTCAAWTSMSSSVSAIYANSGMTTSWYDESSQTCDTPGLKSVYCFEQ